MPDYTAGAMPRGYRVAAMAALAYSLVVIYASLYPFIGWQAIEIPFGKFLSAPWPRWITLEDVGFNFAAYLPLGFLLALALCAWLHPRSAVIIAAVACTMLSLVLETAQQYLPIRIASVVDLLVNSFGGAVGALLAPLFAPGHRLGEGLALLRNRWFVGGPRGDAVLVLAGLWLLTQLHPAPINMGNGDRPAGVLPLLCCPCWPWWRWSTLRRKTPTEPSPNTCCPDGSVICSVSPI